MPAGDDGYEWFRLGYRLHRRGRRADEAEIAYRHAIAAGRSDAWLNLGVLLWTRPGREEDAKVALRAAMRSHNPTDAWRAASELGDMLIKLDGDAVSARECFEFAIEHEDEKRWPMATLNLAYMHGPDGDRRATLATFERFIRLQFARRGADVDDATVRRIARLFTALAVGKRSGSALRKLRRALYHVRRVRRRLMPGGFGLRR